MMDRTFDARLNEIVVEKAIRWADRGVVGVDIAGPRPGGGRYDYTQVAPMVETAREAGLGVTIHVGEEGGEHGREEIGEVIEVLRPDRIGHGILAAGDAELMAALREPGDRARDLPDLEPAHEGAARRGRRARHVPRLRRRGRAVHDRDGRPGDDAHAPARRARAAARGSARSTRTSCARRTRAATPRASSAAPAAPGRRVVSGRTRRSPRASSAAAPGARSFRARGFCATTVPRAPATEPDDVRAADRVLELLLGVVLGQPHDVRHRRLARALGDVDAHRRASFGFRLGAGGAERRPCPRAGRRRPRPR